MRAILAILAIVVLFRMASAILDTGAVIVRAGIHKTETAINQATQEKAP